MKSAPQKSTRNGPEKIELGQYIVSDPAVCGGKVTFKGTRIFVADVLSDVESGLSWDFIIRRWGGNKLGKSSIAEAVQLARKSWLNEDGRLSTLSKAA